jgi:hypothetical protein
MLSLSNKHFILSAIMLGAVVNMLSVVMLNVILLSVLCADSRK